MFPEYLLEFSIHAMLTSDCHTGWVFVIFCFPEAANMTLEEVRAVFQHGFGVRYAEEWRKQQKLARQNQE